MGEVRARKRIDVRYPIGHERAGLLVGAFLVGDVIPDEALELMSDSVIQKATTAGDPPEEKPAPTSTPVENEVVEVDVDVDVDGLGKLSVSDLREIITNENVQVDGSNRKSNLIEAIRVSRSQGE